ncbi:MAG TPA: glutathione S-transferase N-terminal domain-containing protein [Allosphingosinicella sp.]|jgi:glutathione S-transferase|nr:glutathione S-transferase N-terminal domain-containing protein [Allosphingosinicella sp.]
MTRLFYSPGACSLVAHVALEEAGAAFEAVRTAIADKAHKRPEYLAINPRGLIPALEAEGEAVTETIAILAWIGHRWPDGGQLPLDDLTALARLFERLSFFATTVHHGGFGPIYRARAAGIERPQAELAADRERLRGLFGEIDALLAPGPWLLGERYTLADPYPLVFRRWARRLDLDVSPHRHWTAHSRRMIERPAVARALAREGLDPAEF